MKKVLLVFMLVIIAVAVKVQAQPTDSLLNRAHFYINNDEYGMAIPLLSNYLLAHPDDANTYKLRGNCRFETKDYKNAIVDYKAALTLKPEFSDIVYNLGNVYDILENADSAKYWFKRYTEMEPHITDGYLRLSILYMYYPDQEGKDAIFYAQRAVEMEPENPEAINILAMSYFTKGEYFLSEKIVQDGLEIDSNAVSLLQTAGLNAFFLGKYHQAIQYFKKASALSPDNPIPMDYMAQSQLIVNTPATEYNLNEGEIHFNKLTTNYILEHNTILSGNSSSYSYNVLRKKFITEPDSMGLDEYIMFYIGFTEQSAYSPYQDYLRKIYNFLPDDPQGAIRLAEETVQSHPTQFQVYRILANMYLQNGNYHQYYVNICKYFGFLNAIKATGDGKSAETAFLISDINHEYEIAANLELKVTQQSLVSEKHHDYDILTGTNPEGMEVNLYFNIDKPFSTLSKTFRSREIKTEKKARRRKAREN